MLRTTLHQMRTSAGRLAAAGIAIVLGTAFVAAALLASATIERATYNSFTASYADADAVATSLNDGFTRAQVDAVRATDGVAAADLHAYIGLELTGSTATEWTPLAPTPSAESLSSGTVVEGDPATQPGQIVLGEAVAERIGVTVGDEVAAQYRSFDPVTGDQEVTSLTFEVSGLQRADGGLFASQTTSFVAADAVADLLFADDAAASGEILISTAPGADADAVADQVATLLPESDVRSIDEIARQLVTDTSGSTVVFLVIALGFATVALAVASLVITNTFQVLVAQRTRTLALLRCVGASRRQVRFSVLTEAGLLGVLASTVGLALGALTVIGGARLLEQFYPELAIGVEVPFGAHVPVLTLLAGTVVTVLAALVPARMATRVAPVAALRPLEGEPDERASRTRSILSVAALAIGAIALGGGSLLALTTSGTDAADVGVLGGLMLGMLGGMVSLVGLLASAVLWVPMLLRLLGRLAGRGVPARIATANAVRNPRRTAATANALVIGVALVTMMSTAAFSARDTLLQTLDYTFPVDLQAISPDPSTEVLPSQASAVAGADGIAASIVLPTTDGIELRQGGVAYWGTLVPAVDGLREVLADPSLIADLGDDDVLVDPSTMQSTGISPGDAVTATGIDGATIELRAVPAETGRVLYVTEATFDQLAPDAVPNSIWAAMADDADPVAASVQVQEALNELGVADPQALSLQVHSAAIERGEFAQIIDTMLAVVLGLLAVAVVIALVGVANTLSLSVIERRRENATLRAMGLTRGQLRAMLAIEGVLIAVVGALVGAVSGLIYGWAGASIVLGGFGGGDALRLGVPWPQLAAIAAVAVLAGLAASVLPARSAVRQPPVAALATD